MSILYCCLPFFQVFAAICCGLATASAVFALRTWQTYEGGTKGSVAIFFI